MEKQIFDILTEVYYWTGFLVINGTGIGLAAFLIYANSEFLLTRIIKTYNLWNNCMEYFKNRKQFNEWKNGSKQ